MSILFQQVPQSSCDHKCRRLRLSWAMAHLYLDAVRTLSPLSENFADLTLPAWAQDLYTIYAMRFMIGVFETSRRTVFYCIASPLGLMFAGYLHAAAYINLNGVNGLEGWRWLFIIITAITLPVSILGFAIFPDVPNGKKPRMLSQEDFDFAAKRLQGLVAPTQVKVSWGLLKRILGRWHFWVFVFHWCMLDQNIQPSGTPMSLYLKVHPKIYSVTQINTIPTIPLAIYIVLALAFGVIADRTGKFWVLALIGTVPNLIGSLLLAVYDIGEGGRLFAFCITGTLGVLSPMTMSWVSLIMAGDAEERAVATVSMNAIGQGFTAWTQLLAFPATAAPHFRKGFINTSVTAFFQILSILTIYVLARRGAAKKARVTATSE
ncbi:uncharacterized protein PAC_14198 [Phialocephala subalpina]|uniref:Uncharacterized protein n=1 Tax=Phialocephala subalpina TaxID=576137 RepID=A0A1L7XGY8_9HELO|nr:uncharacterized protein PAC_14198 [Phialocephala subalpina]